jgi:5-methylcytosine-specific restriction endonuclease McrA
VKNEVRKLPGPSQVKPSPAEQQPLREPAPSSTSQAPQPPLLFSHAPEIAAHTGDAGGPSGTWTEQTPTPSSARTTAPALTPLREGRYKVQFTADQQLHDKLKEAQQLMRHQIPNGDIAKLVDRALDLLIAHKRKQHFGATDKPRAAHPQTVKPPRPSNPDSRHIPSEVKRQVLARDGEQCSYVSPQGRRCEQRERLEFHHKRPYGRGGAATVENIVLACSAHNLMHADDDYGRSFMRRCIERSRRERAASRFVPGPDNQVDSPDRRPDGQG